MFMGLTPQDKVRSDRVIGLSIVAIAFLIALGISYWAREASRPKTAAPPAPPTTESVDGWPHAVDPVQTLEAARRLTERPILRGFVAEGVKSDGTIDFSDGNGHIRYVFQSPAGHGPQPLREPASLPRRHYCGRQTVHVKKVGLVADPDRADYPCMSRPVEALPDPRCTLRDVWRVATEKRGVPENPAAKIEYYRAKAGPAWRFELPGSLHRFSLYGDCERLLEGPEAIGAVP
jgi:hypothetical protein